MTEPTDGRSTMTQKLRLLRLMLLVVLPASMLELVNNIYNLYVPIYLQAGGAEFSKTKAVMTFGFGMGAFFVGFWLAVDNVLAFLVSPFIGAWSDRIRTRLGRRLPFVLATLPCIVIGYFLIPLIPTRIPQELNGQTAHLAGLFILFIGSCIIYFLGFVPVRAILQTLRQEAVSLQDRSKVESWYIFIVNACTILAFTYGRRLYAIYGPLIFWCVLGLYGLSVIVLMLSYREPKGLMPSDAPGKTSGRRQIMAIFKGVPPLVRRNMLLYLASVLIYSMVLGAFLNFTPSWVVVVLKAGESQASKIMSILWIAATIAPLPAGYLGATRFGRRNLYVLGLAVTAAACLVLFVAPEAYAVGLIGLGAGMSIALSGQLPLASEIAYDKNALGTLIGVYNLIYMLGFLLGANITGLVIQITSYNSLYVVIAGCGLGAILAALGIRLKTPPENSH